MSLNSSKKKLYLDGRWTKSQNDRFMNALQKYGRNWI